MTFCGANGSDQPRTLSSIPSSYDGINTIVAMQVTPADSKL